ncbi:MAG: response regulator [Lachnospiraceae bacterium]|nr:response regulator [Lachnospiraceae bacterium]
MIRLLMVDDEPTTIRRILSRIDFAAIGITEIREAGDSEEALKICGEWQPDILLSDIMMPKMNGIELTARIREMYPSLQVIFLSGYMEKEFLKGAIHLQVIDYIEKPIDMAELTRTLETAVERVQSSENSSVRLEKMGGEYELSLKRKLALELSHEKCDPALTERYFKELFPGEQAVHCFAMQLCFYQPEEKEFSTLLGFIPAIQQAADACMLQVAAAVRYDYISAFIFAGEKKRISDKVFFVSEYLRELRKELVLRNSVYTIGTGHVCQALAELPESFSEALQATDLAFFHGPGYHSYYRKNARKFDFEQSGARDIISGIKKNGRESTVFRLREMQTELSRSEGTDPEDIRRFYSSIILQLFREAM